MLCALSLAVSCNAAQMRTTAAPTPEERAAREFSDEADRLLRQGKVPEAAAAYQKAADANPADPLAWDRAGWAHLDNADAERAKKAFETGRLKTPKGARPSGGLLVALYVLKEKEPLFKLLRDYLPSYQLAEGEKVLDGGMKAALRSAPWSFGLGYLYSRVLGNSTRAVFHAESAAQQQPMNAQAWLLLVEINQALNRADQEQAAAVEFLKLEPESADAFRLRAQRVAASGDAESAAVECEDGLKKHPQSVELYVMLARYHERAGKPVEAEAALKRLLKSGSEGKVDGAEATAQSLLAAFHVRRKQYAAAEPYYKGLAVRAGSTALARHNWAAVLAVQSRWKEAAAAYETAAAGASAASGANSEEYLPLSTRAAFCLSLASERDAARTLLEKALSTAPRSRSYSRIEAASTAVWLGSTSAPKELGYVKDDERWAAFPFREEVDEGENRPAPRTSLPESAWRHILKAQTENVKDCWPAELVLARISASDGNGAASARSLETVAKARPDWWAPHYVLADYFTRGDQLPRAQAELTRVLQLAPDCRAARGALSLLKNRAPTPPGAKTNP